MKRLLKENGLTITMIGLFLVFWVGQSLTGHAHDNEERKQHGQPPITWSQYVRSGEFVEATAENWESEFFQMAAFVFLSAFLMQRGSPESKKTGEEEKDETRPTPDAPWPVKRGGVLLSLYSHSLTIALTTLFLLSFVLHARGGLMAENEMRALHGQPDQTMLDFLGGSTFWFQSLQNWQSEFLSVGVLVVLTIFLRERGSAQSKPVNAPHRQTGS
jgi:hypothetical protein